MKTKRTGFIAAMVFCCLFMASTIVLAQDNGNGTVTIGDKIWLKDAGCIGLMNWTEAGNAAAALASGQCRLTDGSSTGSWRLPTRDELLAVFASSGSFTNVRNSYYWTQSMGGTGSSPYFCHVTGTCLPTGKTSIGYVWPVRSR
ncbi:MAG: DUF1566 domain-containing protein [Deltaproteobacteria bacterium]